MKRGFGEENIFQKLFNFLGCIEVISFFKLGFRCSFKVKLFCMVGGALKATSLKALLFSWPSERNICFFF